MFCLCCMAALKSHPALSFNALIFPILRIVCTISFNYSCKPSSKIFYWPFQGGTSFVDLLCFCSVLSLLCLCARLFICALWSPAGKGLTSWLSFVVSSVSLSLSHWYPGSGVVLNCIDFWSFHPYILRSTQRITADVLWKWLHNRLYLIHLHVAKIKSRAVTR